jgi:flagella basal body P-ring formation protein FlgA
LTALSTYASSNPGSNPGGDAFSDKLKAELSSRFPDAKIELLGEPHWTGASPQGKITFIMVGEENARGQVQFEVHSRASGSPQDSASYGWVEFSASIQARVLARRVFPGEKLESDQFHTRDLNIASGELRELRGLILSASTDISSLEARQTLIEGQPLLSSAIERIPDVRRGDAIRVELVSNGLVLSTSAVASESAYLDGTVRVLTEKTKRELVGKLVAPGLVEVKL